MLLAVVLTTLLPLSVIAKSIRAERASASSALARDALPEGVKWLYKRRRGGGDSSDSDSGSSSSSDYDDYDSDSGGSSGGGGGGSSPPPMCYYDKNATIEMHNMMSYGHFYEAGIGSPTNNSGGYTPEGSGTFPRWDNRSGSWHALRYYDVSYLLDDKDYVYLGGAGVPYTSGKTSPNGVTPTRLDLSFETAPYQYFGDGDLCSVPNASWAYRYAAAYNWTELSMDDATYGETIEHLTPVYCCCALETVCGCDDGHRNASFVGALLEELGIVNHPRNTTDVCSVTVDGEMALIVNGTLANGSTMADRDVTPTKETVLVRESEVCDSGEAAASGAGTYAVGLAAAGGWMVMGGVVGMGLVLL